MENAPEAPTTPHARSSVNGMIIPLLPHQGGILHRFAQPENRLVIASTSEPAAEAERMVSEGTPDPMLQQALQENAQLREQAQSQEATIAAQGDALKRLQEQMAALMATQAAAPLPQATPVKPGKAKAQPQEDAAATPAATPPAIPPAGDAGAALPTI